MSAINIVLSVYLVLGREDLASMFLTDARKLNAYGPLKVCNCNEMGLKVVLLS